MNKESKSESPLIGERLTDEKLSKSLAAFERFLNECPPEKLDAMIAKIDAMFEAKEDSLPEATLEKKLDFDGPLAMVDHYQRLANYYAEEAAKWENKFRAKEDNKAFGEQEDTDKMFKEWIGDTGAADENQSELWAAAFKVLGFFPSPSKFKSVQEDFHITRKPE